MLAMEYYYAAIVYTVLRILPVRPSDVHLSVCLSHTSS